MQAIRIIEIPGCKMVSSGAGMFGEEKFDHFAEWFSTLPRTAHPRDYLSDAGEGRVCWLYMYGEGMDVPPEFEIIDFTGGLYAVATDIDQRTDIAALDAARDEFINASGFEVDISRARLGNIITPPSAHEVLGYHQMDYYTPIKRKG